jgi:hypothetical protein
LAGNWDPSRGGASFDSLELHYLGSLAKSRWRSSILPGRKYRNWGLILCAIFIFTFPSFRSCFWEILEGFNFELILLAGYQSGGNIEEFLRRCRRIIPIHIALFFSSLFPFHLQASIANIKASASCHFNHHAKPQPEHAQPKSSRIQSSRRRSKHGIRPGASVPASTTSICLCSTATM